MDIENRDHLVGAIKYLSRKKIAPTRAAILFTEFITKWEKDEQLLDFELSELVSSGLAIRSDDVYSLTSEGRKLAQQNDAREFGTMLIANEQSAAYRIMCREVYGSDRFHFDMMTQNQLEKLLDVLNISKCKNILDAGCGTGAITEYIADQTNGNITGIDFSSDAIEFAQKRKSKKQNRLLFQVMDMENITFSPNKFDAILSIDTLYFVTDLQNTITSLRNCLQEKGQMGIFYSSKISVDDSKDMLRPENSRLAQALEKCGMEYETWDFTAEEKELWKKCIDVANELKDRFVEEGNLAIYNQHIEESTRWLGFHESGLACRYLFHAWLS